MVKETQILRYQAWYFGVIPVWEPLSDKVRLTGRCRRIGDSIQREAEFTHTEKPLFGKERTVRETAWLGPDKIRTVEYFQCDEASE